MPYESFLKELSEEKQKLENYVLEAQLADYASYRYTIGKIQGIQLAIDITKIKRSNNV